VADKLGAASSHSEEIPSLNEEVHDRAEAGSLLRGYRRRYENNKQIIAAWREYGRLARLLRREYRGREIEADAPMIANWITAASIAENALASLTDEQDANERTIQRLIGQLSLPE
jgi:hypothetical protein